MLVCTPEPLRKIREIEYNIPAMANIFRKILWFCLWFALVVAVIFGLWRVMISMGEKKVLARLLKETPVAQLIRVGEVKKDGKVWGMRLLWVTLDPVTLAKNQSSTFEVEGDKVYVDALVIKFLSRYVAAGDGQRGKSIALFYRLFGEHQRPAEGFSLAGVSEEAWGYSVHGALGYFEISLLKKFWNYSNDSTLATRDGVDCAFGEAVMLKPQRATLYTLSLAHNGSVLVRPEAAAWVGELAH